jgi:hypothetical protein
LFTLINQLDDQQKQACWALRHVALQRHQFTSMINR